MNVLAQLIAKSMTKSMQYLEETVPFELTSRYLAIYMNINKRDCDYYFKAVVTDADQRKAICSTYRFEVLSEL